MTFDETATPRRREAGAWERMVQGGFFYMLPNMLFLGFAFLPFATGESPASELPRTIIAVTLIGVTYLGVSLATTWSLRWRILWLVLLIGSMSILGEFGLFFIVFLTVGLALLLRLPAAIISITIISIGAGIASLLFQLPISAILAGVGLLGGIGLAVGRVIWERNDQLRAAEKRIATLAVSAERMRIARDLHDILGHSLTTITVKAQLAARLVDTDPDRARAEITELEEIARVALSDVRATTSGMQTVRVATEVASARSVLTAAGIQPEVPSAVPELSDELSELFGYVIREGVTNVVRHSGATKCTIAVGASFAAVSDNGTGGVTRRGGSGIAGLSDRVESAGLRLTVESGQHGTTLRAEAK